MTKTYGAVVGRFQVHRLHKGHTKLLNFAKRKHNHLIVFIGDRAQTPPTPTNPLSFKVREGMILKKYPHAIVRRLVDHASNDLWTQQLDSLINEVTNGAGATFYCGRDSFAPYYNGTNEIVTKHFGCDELNASALRAHLKDTTFNNVHFRAGIIHAWQNAWHRTYYTVDMAMFRREPVSDRLQICLVRKPNETLWQLPGGFVDKGEKFAEAAAREMKEETGLIGSHWQYVDDFMINDWRIRGVSGVDHKTVLLRSMVADHNSEPVADDDIEEARWFSLHLVVNNLEKTVKSNHRKMFETLQESLDFIF